MRASSLLSAGEIWGAKPSASGSLQLRTQASRTHILQPRLFLKRLNGGPGLKRATPIQATDIVAELLAGPNGAVMGNELITLAQGAQKIVDEVAEASSALQIVGDILREDLISFTSLSPTLPGIGRFTVRTNGTKSNARSQPCDVILSN